MSQLGVLTLQEASPESHKICCKQVQA